MTGVEVQLWSSDGLTQLGVLTRRWGVRWQDQYNQAGMGAVTVHVTDPLASETNFAYFNIVRLVYEGATRFAWRIENRALNVVASGGEEAQAWELSGRGVLGLIGDGVVYPEYGLSRTSGQTRNFFFGSQEGDWYVSGEWSAPQGIRYDATAAAQIPWGGDGQGNGPFPTEWPDMAAQWIWPTDPSQRAAGGTAWFRGEFTLDGDTNVGIYATADNGLKLYLDGEPIIIDDTDDFGWRRRSVHETRLSSGSHLLAAEVENNNFAVEEVQPITTWTTPTYNNDGNAVHESLWDASYTDGGYPYVSDGGAVAGHYGEDAFDGNSSTYWLSVGNFLGWSSAYEWVQGSFSSQEVNAVRVYPKGGPYECYISLSSDSGSTWQGSNYVPYRPRSVDHDGRIKYVRKVILQADKDTTIPIPGNPTANMVRITMHATWDSGVYYYRWRAAIREIQVSTTEGTYVRGGNYAGLLVSVNELDDSGTPTAALFRSNTTAWLCKTGDRPGWMPHHILKELVEEAQGRNAAGPLNVSLGFTATTDSNSVAWDMTRRDRGFRIGESTADVAVALSEDSDMDVWMDPATLTLEAAEGRGTDLSTGSDPVALRPAESLTQLEVNAQRPYATRVLIETEWGWGESAEFAGESTYGRVEGIVSLGGAMSVADGEETGQSLLNSFAAELTDATANHTDLDGPKPYVDYNVGDTILAPDGFAKGSFAAHKVLAVSVTERGDGVLEVRPELEKVI